MCHACVTEAVKARLLSRRDLFFAAPAAAVLATAGAAPAAIADGSVNFDAVAPMIQPALKLAVGLPNIMVSERATLPGQGRDLKEVVWTDEIASWPVPAARP